MKQYIVIRRSRKRNSRHTQWLLPSLSLTVILQLYGYNSMWWFRKRFQTNTKSVDHQLPCHRFGDLTKLMFRLPRNTRKAENTAIGHVQYKLISYKYIFCDCFSINKVYVNKWIVDFDIKTKENIISYLHNTIILLWVLFIIYIDRK